MTEQEMRARGFSEADIAYVKKLSADRFRQQQQPIATAGPQNPQKPQPRARNAKTPMDFILNILRGGGL